MSELHDLVDEQRALTHKLQLDLIRLISMKNLTVDRQPIVYRKVYATDPDGPPDVPLVEEDVDDSDFGDDARRYDKGFVCGEKSIL